VAPAAGPAAYGWRVEVFGLPSFRKERERMWHPLLRKCTDSERLRMRHPPARQKHSRPADPPRFRLSCAATTVRWRGMKKREYGVRKKSGLNTTNIRERAAHAHAEEKYRQARAVWPDISSYGKSKPMRVIIYILNLFGPNRFLSTLLIGFALWFIVRYIGRALLHFFAR